MATKERAPRGPSQADIARIYFRDYNCPACPGKPRVKIMAGMDGQKVQHVVVAHTLGCWFASQIQARKLARRIHHG